MMSASFLINPFRGISLFLSRTRKLLPCIREFVCNLLWVHLLNHSFVSLIRFGWSVLLFILFRKDSWSSNFEASFLSRWYFILLFSRVLALLLMLLIWLLLNWLYEGMGCHSSSLSLLDQRHSLNVLLMHWSLLSLLLQDILSCVCE